MDIISLLPSPSQALRLAVSLFNSMVLVWNYRKTEEPRFLSADYDVDAASGFFPQKPLPRLPQPFEIWEKALSEAPDVLYLGDDDDNDVGVKERAGCDKWRHNVKSWPVLDTRCLQGDLCILQRAHCVLSWLVHFYVHSIPAAEQTTPARVPRSLSIPLVEVSQALNLAPVLTFADTVLWNAEPIDTTRPLSMDNMRFVYSFSGTDDEREFYKVSAWAELRGVEILQIIEDYENLPNVTDIASISKISKDLIRMTGVIEDISEIIQSVRVSCDPHVFYWQIRPWYVGSNAKGPSGPDWIYEGVENSELLDLSGPSAGQSSVMHALDIFLDVDHKLERRRVPAPSEDNKRADKGFMERMRRYMPGKHQKYLNRLASSPRPLRDLAQRTPQLREPYNSTVMALKKLRDLHMRIATLYIVTMARSASLAPPGCPVSAKLAKLEAERLAGRGPVRGTGGNELSLLLKAGRDATRRTAVTDA